MQSHKQRDRVDLKFDTDLLGMLMQAMLAGLALVLIVAVWTGQEE